MKPFFETQLVKKQKISVFSQTFREIRTVLKEAKRPAFLIFTVIKWPKYSKPVGIWINQNYLFVTQPVQNPSQEA